MQIFHDLPGTGVANESTVTIGVFDGVHKGHQALIQRTLQRAHDARRLCAVLTFEPHPVEVLAPHVNIRYLTTIAERTRLIERLGVDALYIVHFTRELSELSAREFVRPLVDRLSMRDLVIGYDFTLGHQRQGNADFLRALGAEWGFTLEVVPPQTLGGQIVSSTRIRAALADGRIADAAQLLGREAYCVSGQLGEHGLVQVDPKRQLPRDGRYKVKAIFDRVGEYVCTAETRGAHIQFECDRPVRGTRGETVTIGFRAPADPVTSAPPAAEGYEEVEHTADVALRVRAHTLEGLFCQAARGMFALMTDVDSVSIDSESVLELRAPDRETLLANWLNELLFRHEMSAQVFSEFHVSITPDCRARGVARGGSPQGEIRKHIKAVTFHELSIVEHDGFFEVTVVFDI